MCLSPNFLLKISLQKIGQKSSASPHYQSRKSYPPIKNYVKKYFPPNSDEKNVLASVSGPVAIMCQNTNDRRIKKRTPNKELANIKIMATGSPD